MVLKIDVEGKLSESSGPLYLGLPISKFCKTLGM